VRVRALVVGMAAASDAHTTLVGSIPDREVDGAVGGRFVNDRPDAGRETGPPEGGPVTWFLLQIRQNRTRVFSSD
jgi:hypothetical protein